MAFDVRDGLYLPQFGNAVLGGMEKGQNLRKGLLEDYVNRKKIEQTNKVEALQNQYLGATDSAEKKDILGKMAVYNPEHAKGIASIATLGLNPFEGTSMEAQKANLQYQRYLAAGYPESEARLNAINDAASTSAQFYTDVGGNRVTVGGLPLPGIGGKPVLGGSPRMQQPTLGGIEPGAGMKGMSESEKVVAMLPVEDHLESATPEEKAFVNEVMSSSDPAKIYNTKVNEHPELKTTFPKWNDTVAGHFKDIHKAINPYSNSPIVKVTEAKAQAEKDVSLGNIQPSTATKLEDKMLSVGDIRSQVSTIRSSFKPEYQTYKVQGGMAWNALKDKFDSKSLTEKDQQGLQEFTEYRANAGQMFSNILNELSGTAVNAMEFKRAENYLPNPGSGIFDGDSPIQMEAKIKKMEEFTSKALAKYAYIRKNGFDVEKVSIDDMPKIMNDRGNSLYTEYKLKGLKGDALRETVTNKLAEEFGLVK